MLCMCLTTSSKITAFSIGLVVWNNKPMWSLVLPLKTLLRNLEPFANVHWSRYYRKSEGHNGKTGGVSKGTVAKTIQDLVAWREHFVWSTHQNDAIIYVLAKMQACNFVNLISIDQEFSNKQVMMKSGDSEWKVINVTLQMPVSRNRLQMVWYTLTFKLQLFQ